MDKFYTIVVGVAVVFLLLCLIAVGIALQKESEEQEYPKLQAKCPDGWAVDVSGCYVNGLNKGTLSNNDIDTLIYDASFGTTVCERQNWTIDNGGVIWDGVSNYNKC